MSKLQSVCTLCMLVCASSGSWAQETSTPPAEPAPESSQQQPMPAYGQDNAPPPVSENPPLSGLDLPSLEPHAAPLSYLQPAATFSESAEYERGQRRRWFGSQLRRPSAGPPYATAVVEQLRLGARLCRRYWVLQCERDRT